MRNLINPEPQRLAAACAHVQGLTRSRFVPACVALALCMLAAGALLWPARGRAASAPCGLATAAFCDTFDEGPAPIRGRGGDLDPGRWSAARLAPSDISGGPANPVSTAPIPPCKASFPSLSVYPPNDTLICDPGPSLSSQLMTAVAIQNYGNNSYMIRQPFDFANRTGRIVFDVDAVSQSSLATYIAVDLTEDPIPAPTFLELQNFETGPVPRNGLMMKWSDSCGLNGNAIT